MTISPHLRIENKRLADCTFKDVCSGSLKLPIFNVTVLKAGQSIFDGAAGFVTVEGGKFRIELLVQNPTKPLSALGLVEQTSGSDAEGRAYTRYVPNILPVGTLLEHDVHVKGRTITHERFSSTVCSANSNGNVDGQIHWIAHPQYFEVYHDHASHFENLVKLKRLPKMPMGSLHRTTAVLDGCSNCVLPQNLCVSNGDVDFDIQIKELLSGQTLIEVKGSDNAEERRQIADITHEVLSFVTGQYCYVIGYLESGAHAMRLSVWSDGLGRQPIRGSRPISTESDDLVAQAFDRYLRYFVTNGSAKAALRAIIVRKLLAANQVHPIREFVLCTSIEAFARNLEPAMDAKQKVDLDSLKELIVEFVQNRSTFEDKHTAEKYQANRERMIGYVNSMNFKNARQIMQTVFEKNQIPWSNRYGHAWAKLRNPSAHGDLGEIDQERVDNSQVAEELWNLLLLGEIGYDGTVIRYGSKGHYLNYPSTSIRACPDHLTVPNSKKKRIKQPKSRTERVRTEKRNV